MSERASQLTAYSFQMPVLDYVFFASLLRWLMLAVIIGSALWLLVRVYGRFLGLGRPAELSQSPDSG
jgi:hypothetical protein